MAGNGRKALVLSLFLLLSLSLSSISVAYRPGDIVPMNKMGQYHSVSTLSPPPHQYILMIIYMLYMVFLSNLMLNASTYFWFQSRTVWQDVIGRHCPTFAVNREVPFEFFSFRVSYFIVGLIIRYFEMLRCLVCCVGFDSVTEAGWLHWSWSVQNVRKLIGFLGFYFLVFVILNRCGNLRS